MELAVGVCPVERGCAVMLTNSPSLVVLEIVVLSGTVDVPFHRGLMITFPASSNKYERIKRSVREGIFEEINQWNTTTGEFSRRWPCLASNVSLMIQTFRFENVEYHCWIWILGACFLCCFLCSTSFGLCFIWCFFVWYLLLAPVMFSWLRWKNQMVVSSSTMII